MAGAKWWGLTMTIAVAGGSLLPSCNGDACGCAIEPRSRMIDFVSDATVVVVATVVDDGSDDGLVAIRPTTWVVGELSLDGDGVYRFPWREVDPMNSGVWTFGADGLPSWDDERAREPAPVPEYPWSIREFCDLQGFERVDPDVAGLDPWSWCPAASSSGSPTTSP